MNNSLLSYTLKLYKQLYLDEVHHREYLSGKVSGLLPLYATVVGGDIWMFIKLMTSEGVTWIQSALFLICLILAIVFIFIYYTVFLHYPDSSIEPEEIFKLIDGVNNLKDDYAEEEITNHITSSFVDAYRTIISENHETNRKYEVWVRILNADVLLLCLCSVMCLCQLLVK